MLVFVEGNKIYEDILLDYVYLMWTIFIDRINKLHWCGLDLFASRRESFDSLKPYFVWFYFFGIDSRTEDESCRVMTGNSHTVLSAGLTVSNQHCVKLFNCIFSSVRLRSSSSEK